MLTARKVAEKLNKPQTTIRHWGQRFRAFIPVAKQGRYYSFLPASLRIFERIGELLKDRKHTYQEIDVVLKKEFGEFKIEDRPLVAKEAKPNGEQRQVVSASYYDNVTTALLVQNDRLISLVEKLTPPPPLPPVEKPRHWFIRLMTHKVF